jgi:HK97 family phage major capsid protein
MNFTQKETELRSKMEPIIVKAQAGTASTEEVTQLKAMTDELTSLKAQMEAAVAAEKAQADLAAGKGVNTVDTTAKVETALLSGKGMTFDDKPEMTEKQARIYGSDEHLKAFANFFKAKGNLNNLDQETLKVVNEMIDTEGGFYVPPQHVNQVIERKVAPSRLANLVTNFQAASNQVRYPTVRYTTDDLYASGMRPTLTGEQPATATTANVTEPVWGETVINIHTYMATLPVSNDFLEDTVNFGSWITKSLMDMADVNIDSQIANGVGGNQGPLGLVTAAGIAVAAGGIATVNTSVDNSFDWNDLVGVTMELPEQYAANGTFVMNRVSAGRTALTLEGADGQPIFRRGGFNNGITEAQPDTLNGYPIAYSAHMPNLANAAVPVIFGDLSQYVLARRGVMTIKVQQEVNYTLNRTLFTLRYRIGGAPVQPAAFRALLCI